MHPGRLPLGRKRNEHYRKRIIRSQHLLKNQLLQGHGYQWANAQVCGGLLGAAQRARVAAGELGKQHTGCQIRALFAEVEVVDVPKIEQAGRRTVGVAHGHAGPHGAQPGIANRHHGQQEAHAGPQRKRKPKGLKYSKSNRQFSGRCIVLSVSK